MGLIRLLDTTGKVSAPGGGANPLLLHTSTRKIGYFESLAPQGFQNNFLSCVSNVEGSHK